jgi:serine/threonine protein kinase
VGSQAHAHSCSHTRPPTEELFLAAHPLSITPCPERRPPNPLSRDVPWVSTGQPSPERHALASGSPPAQVRRLIPAPAIKADFSALLAGQSPDRRKLAQLSDLLERMMNLDPDKRISAKDALRHPFIKEPPAAPAGARAGGK